MRRMALPLLFLVGALIAGLLALRAESDADRGPAPAAGPPDALVITPVLSARRVPQLLVADTADDELAADLESVVAASAPDTCLVVERAGQRIFEHNPQTPLVPASAQKVVTAAAALEHLGPDFTFTTSLASSAVITDGRLDGDLWLVGGGDPVLATADYIGRYPEPQAFTDLAELADALVDQGLTEINGAVVGDETRYDADRYVDSWPPRFTDQNQTGPLSALSVNDGFTRYPDDNPANQLATAAGDPAADAAAQFDDLLEARGVIITQSARSGEVPPEFPTLATISSPPMSVIVEQMLATSDNNTAELLIKEIALSPDQVGATAAGVTRATAVLADNGYDTEGVSIADGSGLSSANSLTCDFLVDMLADSGVDSVLATGLAIGGETGTLIDRFTDTATRGNILAKTGSLNEVSALAGFALGADGAVLSFAYVTNIPELDAAASIAVQQDMGELLVSWPEGPDLGSLGPQPPSNG